MTKTNESALKEYAITKLNHKRGATEIVLDMMEKFDCSKTDAVSMLMKAKAERAKEKAEKIYGGCKDGSVDRNGEPQGNWVTGWGEKKCDCAGGELCGCKGGEEPNEFDLEKKHSEQGDLLWMKAQLADAKKELTHLKKNIGKGNSLIDDLRASVDPITPLPFEIQKNNPDTKEVSVVSVFSDWHIGEVINREEMEGFNSFNLDIATKRVNTYMSKLMDWVKLHRNNYTVKEWVILVLGDLISGDIHYELTATNEFPCPVQASEAGGLLAKAISAGAPHFEKVVVHFVTADNHSRLTKKSQCKQGGLNSWGYYVSDIAQARLSLHKNVEFNSHNVIEAVVRIQNKRYLILHGDGIKGQAGIPFYGIQAKVGKEAVARMHMSEEQKFDTMIMGHFHQPAKMVNWMMSGSLSGTTEYDHKAGRHCLPCQIAFFVHPKWGEFDFTEFWLARDGE
jgi:hypothetical protein